MIHLSMYTDRNCFEGKLGMSTVFIYIIYIKKKKAGHVAFIMVVHAELLNFG